MLLKTKHQNRGKTFELITSHTILVFLTAIHHIEVRTW